MIYLSKKLIFSARYAFFLRFIASPREEYTDGKFSLDFSMKIRKWALRRVSIIVEEESGGGGGGCRAAEGCDKWFVTPRATITMTDRPFPRNDYVLVVSLLPISFPPSRGYLFSVRFLCNPSWVKNEEYEERDEGESLDRLSLTLNKNLRRGGQRVCIRNAKATRRRTRGPRCTMNSRDPFLIISTTVQSGTKSFLPSSLVALCSAKRRSCL